MRAIDRKSYYIPITSTLHQLMLFYCILSQPPFFTHPLNPPYPPISSAAVLGRRERSAPLRQHRRGRALEDPYLRARVPRHGHLAQIR